MSRNHSGSRNGMKVSPPDERARAVRRYWDAHPIASDSVPFERGTPHFFDALYTGWRREVGPGLFDFVEVGCGIAVEGRFLAEQDFDYGPWT